MRFAHTGAAGIALRAASSAMRVNHASSSSELRAFGVGKAPITPLRQAAETSSTCEAWPSTKAALNSIPALPAGWNWDTPNIDVYVSNQSAAVNKALDLFEADIAASDPPEVVAAAKAYVSERRQAMQKLVDHTYTTADGVPGNVALAKLDEVCGVS